MVRWQPVCISIIVITNGIVYPETKLLFYFYDYHILYETNSDRSLNTYPIAIPSGVFEGSLFDIEQLTGFGIA